ncbi:MAG: glycine cleavage system aminomethyltransferase GcvT [Elusimicrobia bacterium]|nr:glycine cleavage system aminomethyltransferase GcvT [Elusimicrobiota bacterium]
MITETLRRTPLFEVQKQLGARMVDFHGWELPIQFSSILKEHQAVRNACGLFDVSHMGQVIVEGPQSLDFLQVITSNDVSKIGPGKGQYSHILNERGGVVDDVILYCLAPHRYFVVVNAATTDKDFAWMRSHSKGYRVELQNLSELYGILAVQGPRAEQIVGDLLPEVKALDRFGVFEKEVFGKKCVVGRTGYTGEDGFEIIAFNEVLSRLWETLLVNGRSFGMLPCGLGARDTLRLEAGYLLYGQDIDDDHTPLEANYAWVVKFQKPDFIGKQALLKQKSEGLKKSLKGFKLLGGGVPRAGCGVYLDSVRLGELNSATYSPTLGVGIGTGYVNQTNLKVGSKVGIEIHGKKVQAEAVPVPFYTCG